MASPLATKLWLPALAAFAMLLSAWLGPLGVPGLAADGDTRERLQGTWLREYDERGVKVRRILKLEPDGAFHESVRVAEQAGRVTEFVHEGTWLYDGTNLKRHYTLMNGEKPSRLNLPFATFQVAFESRNEFVGTDHIHRHHVRYSRVAPETRP